MPGAVLLCPPTYFQVRDRKNPYMRAPIDREKARRQWEALRTALQDTGLKVEIIEPVRDLEDMVFAANQTFVGHHPSLGQFIVPSEMRHPSRQREVSYYVEWFVSRGYRVLALDLAGECMEGHGDLLWHPDRTRIWAGYGFRSTLRGIEKLAARMQDLAFPVTPLQLVDEHFYHLDTCFRPLNSEAALIFPGAFSPEALSALQSQWKRLHELARSEALQFMCNGIVANGRYITGHVTDRLLSILRNEGLEPLLVDTSEFEKSGGSVFCMHARLD
jgi:N-dimethylarginine dimethylaminohydrolase